MSQPHPASRRTWRVLTGGVVLALASIVLACVHPLSDLSQTLAGAAGVLIVLMSALPTLAAITLGAAGWGWMLRCALGRPARGGVLLQLAGGLALMWWLAWLLAWAGGLRMPTAWGLCVVGFAGLVLQARDPQYRARLASLHLPGLHWPAALLGLPIGLLFTAAACPVGTLWRVEAFGYDATSYHLQIPAEWLAAGRMTPLPHNVYSFLPGLTEVGYLQAATMLGSVYAAIEVTQVLHAATAVLAAAAIATTVRLVVALCRPQLGAAPADDDRAGASTGAWVAALFLSIPWVLITASLPYNDMAAIAFGSAALAAALSGGAPADDRVSGDGARGDGALGDGAHRWRDWHGAAWVGILGGAAILAKPTAGPMLVIPAVAAMLVRPAPQSIAAGLRRCGVALAVIVICVIITIAPWLIRNTAWTGNPVFPLASRTLGAAHWESTHVERWARAHGPEGSLSERLALLAQRWLFDAGYGAIGGDVMARWRGAAGQPGRDITRMAGGIGVPIVWLAALAGAGLAWSAAPLRRWVVWTLLVIAWQLVVWLTMTHLQSRFMLFSLAPAGVVIGLGLHRLRAWGGARAGISSLAATALVVSIWSQALGQFREQLPPGLPPALVIDSLPPRATQTRDSLVAHWLNQLPSPARVYLLADANRLIYIRVPVEYHTAFDPDPLARIMRGHAGDPAAITAALRQRGITHVWANWSELDRLAATYGVDPPLSRESVGQLAQQAGWRTIMTAGEPAPVVTVYQLP